MPDPEERLNGRARLYFADFLDPPRQWTVTGDLVCVFEDVGRTDVRNNHEVTDLVQGVVGDDPAFEFDSEAGQFFAYARTEEDAERLVRVIDRLSKKR